MPTINSTHRRRFLQNSLTGVGAAYLAAMPTTFAEENKQATGSRPIRAGVIGATGRGDYGHGIDRVWLSVPKAELVAVADFDPKGREEAGRRLGVKSLYADYRQMLDREKLDVVSICPRWLGQREEMVAACAAAGCHMFCEKPFAIDATMADRMLSACKSAGVKVAVAHQQRITPGMAEARAMLADGRLGKILSLRARGKEDQRAGGQDLIVLGDHWFDLMTLLAGEPRWVTAQVSQNGRPVTQADARPAEEELGWIAGNEIAAMFGFDNAANGYFESKATAQEAGIGERFQLTLECTKGTVLVRGGFDQFYLPHPAFNPTKKQVWQPLGTPEWRKMPPAERTAWCNAQIVGDLLRSIEKDREPLCSGAAAGRAVEMCQAVYAAHLTGQKTTLPLAQRQHPLAKK